MFYREFALKAEPDLGTVRAGTEKNGQAGKILRVSALQIGVLLRDDRGSSPIPGEILALV